MKRKFHNKLKVKLWFNSRFLFITIILLCCFICSQSSAQYARTIKVNTEIDLQKALEKAKPGDEILVEKGEYKGNFIIPSTVNGTKMKPISLHGNGKVIINGGTISTGYVLHLQANYWSISNIELTNGLKGLICDNACYNVIDNVIVHEIGEEGIHFRKFSCHNTLKNSTITNTGLKTADYGEGVYIGSAISNWPKYTNNLPDKSDSNTVMNNHIGPKVSAECIDLKEGTTGGLIYGNTFNAEGITGANSGDSWMDVKGNGYLIESNVGTNPKGSVLADGFQVHCAVDGWGCNNVFKNNTCTVNADGYGINITLKSSKGSATGNKVYANNKVITAGKGLTNIPVEAD